MQQFELKQRRAPDIFRANCFGNEYFAACLTALQMDEEEDEFNTWRDILGKKWTHHTERHESAADQIKIYTRTQTR